MIIYVTGQNIKSYYISQEQFDMLQWSLEVLNMTSPPAVLSVSWGSGESGYGKEHLQAANAEFQKMAAMGFTVLVASGDEGTGKTGIFGCRHFDPTWCVESCTMYL